MGLDVYVEDSDENYFLSDIYRLIKDLNYYSPNLVTNYSYLEKIINNDDNDEYLDPKILLYEISDLKNKLTNIKRPYIALKDEESTYGLRFFPKSLEPYAQVVTQIYDGIIDSDLRSKVINDELLPDGKFDSSNVLKANKTIHERLRDLYEELPVSLIADNNWLYLVTITDQELKLGVRWDNYEFVRAKSFKWENSELIADNNILSNISSHFKKNKFFLEQAALSDINIYYEWQDEVNELIRACNDAIKISKRIIITL
jgi:hypothetical protein